MKRRWPRFIFCVCILLSLKDAANPNVCYRISVFFDVLLLHSALYESKIRDQRDRERKNDDNTTNKIDAKLAPY